jgi:hypothetical protein
VVGRPLGEVDSVLGMGSRNGSQRLLDRPARREARGADPLAGALLFRGATMELSSGLNAFTNDGSERGLEAAVAAGACYVAADSPAGRRAMRA